MLKAPSFAPRFAPARDAAESAIARASLARSNAQYAALAVDYDALTPRLEPLRRDAHALLRLQPGDTVMDVGCGTGKSLAALSAAVGATGRVIAVEPCTPMLAQARSRAAALGLSNIEFLETDVGTVDCLLPAASVNAMLFMFTHDVLQSEAAIRALLQVAAIDARLALAGGKFFSGPLAVLNPWVQWRQRPYCTTFTDYDAPWRKLFATAGIVAPQWQARYGGIAYLAQARWQPAQEPAST